MSGGSPILDSARWVRPGQPRQTFEHRTHRESEVDLWPTSLPDHRRRIIAVRALPPRKTPEDCQRCSRIIQAGRSVSLNYRAHDEVRLGLTVLKEMPRHFGHRLLEKKKARPQQGNGTGLEVPLAWDLIPAAMPHTENADFVERLLVSADIGAVHLGRV